MKLFVVLVVLLIGTTAEAQPGKPDVPKPAMPLPSGVHPMIDLSDINRPPPPCAIICGMGRFDMGRPSIRRELDELRDELEQLKSER